MLSSRLLWWCIVACATVAGFGTGSAAAAPILVMDRDGTVERRDDPALPPAGHPLADLPAPMRAQAMAVTGVTARAARARGPARARTAQTPTPRARRAAARIVRRELRRLRRRGRITVAEVRRYRRIYDNALRTRARLTGARGAALQGVINNTNHMAQRGELTAPRLHAVFLTLERNRQWWTSGRLLRYGERVGFTDSEIVWQYYPGEGIQVQVLGTFGKLNGLWMAKDDRRLRVLADEMVEYAATRRGALAWEYYFYFGGGRPPWVSAMAQATGMQALARASQRLDEPAYLETARKALRLLRLDAPVGVRTRTDVGVRFLLYSFSPGQHVLNGFIQTLVGLHDYATISGHRFAHRLFRAGERQARRDLEAADTGAWSLYQTGGAEATLDYQQLVTEFIGNLCNRTDSEHWCDAHRRFTGYLREPPTLELVTSRVRAGRTVLVRFRTSKLARVGMTIRRGETTSLSTSANVTRGTHGYSWRVPTTPGRYEVVLSGTDPAGNTGRITATIRVLGGAAT